MFIKTCHVFARGNYHKTESISMLRGEYLSSNVLICKNFSPAEIRCDPLLNLYWHDIKVIFTDDSITMHGFDLSFGYHHHIWCGSCNAS